MKSFGGLATIASLMAAILALIIGKVTDQYSKRVLIRLGAFYGHSLAYAHYCHEFLEYFLWIPFRISKEMAFYSHLHCLTIRAGATHVVPYAVFFRAILIGWKTWPAFSA